MFPLVRRALVASFACALLATAAPVQAQAAPEPAVAAPRIKYPDRRDLPSSIIEPIVWGRDIAVASVNTRYRTMDYRKADRADRGHSLTRERVAAGLRIGGGRITNITAAELRRVKRHIPRGVYVQPWNPFRAAVPENGCTGISKAQGGINHELTWIRVWLNSCETTNIVHMIPIAALVVGMICMLTPGGVLMGAWWPAWYPLGASTSTGCRTAPRSMPPWCRASITW